MTVHITLGGRPVRNVRLVVPNGGPWHATVDFAEGEDTELTGRQTLAIGSAVFSGTVDPNHSGTYGGLRRARMTGGAGAWSNVIPKERYHNDAGVSAEQVARDAATACGESLGEFTATAKLAADFARKNEPASRTLDAVAGDVPWRVDAAGTTHVSPWPAFTPKPDDYEVLDFNPAEKLITVVADDVRNILPGARLSRGLPTTQAVTALEVQASESSIRGYAWATRAADPVMSALVGIVEHVAARRLWGHYRYRVVRMVGDRVTLQAVRAADGLPDLLAISMRGAPGVHAELANGSHVLVVFEAGDRAAPAIVAFAAKGDPGFVPTLTTIGGDNAASEAARKGDTVQVVLPPAVFNGTIAGSPATGVLMFTTGTTQGTIVGGSAKVKIGT